ncbi:MAG: hypothetical protein WC994_11330 [Brumimicrobium sp.]
MDEKQLSEKFYNFLENEKGFPKNSLLKQAPAYSINSRRTQVDLLLLDTRIGEYIGIVEFKVQVNPQIKKTVKNQIDLYQTALKTDSLPFYLVFPNDQEDFHILVYGDNEWVAISKDEFPEFETLSAKKKIEEKVYEKEREEEIKDEIDKKRELKKKTSLWTLTSLTAGILTAILSFYLTIDKQKNESIITEQYSTQIQKLQDQIDQLEKSRLNIPSLIDTLHVVDSSSTVLNLERRIEIIENGISTNPERTLSIKDIRSELDVIQEQIKSQEKLIALRNENLINRIDWLSSIVIGMIVALFSAAIGFVLTNYNSRKNTTANKTYKQ